jgi:hypothetical protein
VLTVFDGGDVAAARRAVDGFVADFFAAADFFTAGFPAAADFPATFFAAVFRCGALLAALFFATLRGVLRAATAFFARFAGARACADLAPVEPRADFFADLRAALLLRWVGLIVVSASGEPRRSGAGSVKPH